MGITICYYCSGEATETHHRVPRCDGGSDDAENQVEVCRPCHVQVHAADWAEWGRMGGRKSARMRRMYAGGQRAFRAQMRALALMRWQAACG